MSNRSFWAVMFIAGMSIAFLWPYIVPGSSDPLRDGLLRAAASGSGIGAVYLIARWATRGRPIK
jgi:hypothetical protein